MRLCASLTSWTILLLCASVAKGSLARALFSVDYGADSFKASLVKPGHFDVLLNRDSKRKTPSVVALRGEERHVGTDAATLSTRFPRDAVPAIKLLIGDEQVALHKELYGLESSVSSRGARTISLNGGTAYTSEELLAMQFAHAADMAKAGAKEKVTDVIVTVPAFFDQSARQAVLDAIDLAGLKSLGLINDGTAVAINFATPRTFSAEPENHLFVDAGASAIRATLASFSTKPDADAVGLREGRNVTQIEILGVGWDQRSGGAVLDGRLRDILQAGFEKEAGSLLSQPLNQNARARAKLLREGNRVKHVLSANAQAQARIENLAEDIDLRLLVTREELEAACADLSDRMARPISDALQMAGLTIDHVQSVVLVGGHTRVPMVQAAIKSIVPEAKIAQNLNADEAAVMGAALHGAALSRQFRTKEIRVHDIALQGFDLSHTAQSAIVSANGTLPSLFHRKTKLDTTKTITFEADQNFTISFSPASLETDAPAQSSILTARIGGIDAAVSNSNDTSLSTVTVNVEVEIGGEGLLRVLTAKVLPRASDAKAPSVAGRLFDGLFGGSPKSADPSPAEDSSPVNETEIDAAAPASVVKPLALPVAIDYPGVGPMSKTEKLEAKKRLRDIEQAETRKRAREEARNQVESTIYRLRDELESDSFKRCSTSDEREKISAVLSETSEWLFDAAETAITKDLRHKRNELERLVRPIQARISEEKDRPEAVTDFQIALFRGQTFHLSAVANATTADEAGETRRHTVEELEQLSKLLQDENSWLEALQARQAELEPWADPILRSAELLRRAKQISQEVGKLSRKPIPRKPKATAGSAAAAQSAETESISPSEAESATQQETPASRPGDEL